MNRFKLKATQNAINDNKEEESDDDGSAKDPESDKDSPIRQYIM
jgi:hypothetical protein